MSLVFSIAWRIPGTIINKVQLIFVFKLHPKVTLFEDLTFLILQVNYFYINKL